MFQKNCGESHLTIAAFLALNTHQRCRWIGGFRGRKQKACQPCFRESSTRKMADRVYNAAG